MHAIYCHDHDSSTYKSGECNCLSHKEYCHRIKHRLAVIDYIPNRPARGSMDTDTEAAIESCSSPLCVGITLLPMEDPFAHLRRKALHAMFHYHPHLGPQKDHFKFCQTDAAETGLPLCSASESEKMGVLKAFLGALPVTEESMSWNPHVSAEA